MAGWEAVMSGVDTTGQSLDGQVRERVPAWRDAFLSKDVDAVMSQRDSLLQARTNHGPDLVGALGAHHGHRSAGGRPHRLAVGETGGDVRISHRPADGQPSSEYFGDPHGRGRRAEGAPLAAVMKRPH